MTPIEVYTIVALCYLAMFWVFAYFIVTNT